MPSVFSTASWVCCSVTRLVARIWIKAPGGVFDATSVYNSSIQGLCSYFDHHLARTGDIGACIADSRNKFKNVRVSHSIFTQKFGTRRGAIRAS